MYTELAIINKINCKKTQNMLLLDFLEEYAGWLQHLKSVGSAWGANGEEVGANKEKVKCRKHIEAIKNEIIQKL